MEAVFKNMDFLIKHWAPFFRTYPSAFPLVSMNFLRKKDHWVRHRFDTCNFSLILRGSGEFHRNGKKWRVEAPCVITQWPGDYVEYGPSSLEEGWDEFYMIYRKKEYAAFKKNGFIDINQPIWSIRDRDALVAPLNELAVLAGSRDPESVVDRVDRVCERLILETWSRPPSPESSFIRLHAILAELERRLAEPVDFDELAARHGMSGSTFRRRWKESFNLPPARYLQEQRMRKACRLLVESSVPIREIAFQVGFKDEFYFSRRFHLEHGVSPREYRKTYRLNRS